MKKVAICLPSYNESHNIQNITKLIDQDLSALNKEYEFTIVNCDNSSPDETSKLFLDTKTITPKVSILTKNLGKGENLYRFFLYCKENDIDYAITIDSDTESYEDNWIHKFLSTLESGYDFVCPTYQRRLEEGNTTNHFAVYAIYYLYGIFLRQPIGGDYGFNKKFIDIILKKELTPNIKKYGIDIFMVITAISNNLRLKEVSLGRKVHGPSYYKMDKIFYQVLMGFIDSYQEKEIPTKRKRIYYQPFILKHKKWEYMGYFNQKYQDLLTYFNYTEKDYKKIKKEWIDELIYFFHNVKIIDEEYIDRIQKLFQLRAISFWLENKDNDNWDLEIKKTCKELIRKSGNQN